MQIPRPAPDLLNQTLRGCRVVTGFNELPGDSDTWRVLEPLGLYNTQDRILIQEKPLPPTLLQSITLVASFKMNGVNGRVSEIEEATWPNGKG